MKHIPPYRSTSSEVISETKLFRLEVHERTEDSTGRTGTFYILDAPNWINVVAITTNGAFILVEQFRHGTQKNEVELVGGLVDGEEEPERAALRELREETGYVPSPTSRIELIGCVHPNPAFLTNKCYTYLITDCIKEHEQSLDEHERIHVETVTESELLEMITSGKIDHSLVLNAYLWYQLSKR